MAGVPLADTVLTSAPNLLLLPHVVVLRRSAARVTLKLCPVRPNHYLAFLVAVALDDADIAGL